MERGGGDGRERGKRRGWLFDSVRGMRGYDAEEIRTGRQV